MSGSIGFFAGLFAGLFAPLRGLLFALRRPRLWPRLALLGGVNVLVGAGLVLAARALAGALAGPLRVEAWPAIVRTAGPILFVVVVAGLLFLVLQPLVTSPFVDHLTERVEELAGGACPKVPLLLGAWHALTHGLLKLGLYAIAVGASFLLVGTAGPAVIVGWALFAVSAAFDVFDYPLARRRLGFGAKWRFLFAHPGLTFGFGLAALAIAAVPLLPILLWPFAAIGATLAYVDSTRDGGSAPARA